MAPRLRLSANGVSVDVRLTPKSSRTALEGWTSGANGSAYLKARVRAVPQDGKANAALIELLAESLGVAKSHVRIAGGQSARLKRIEIAGDGAVLAARLEALGDAP